MSDRTNSTLDLLPSFSVVVATHSRPRQLARCLEALADLDYPRDRVEVLVVDDGGSKSLDRVIAPYRDRLNLALLSQARAGPGAARNTGAARAKRTFLAFTDDDCIVSPDWLTANVSVSGPRTGSRYRNSDAMSISTGTRVQCSIAYFATRPEWNAVPQATTNTLFTSRRTSVSRCNSSSTSRP